MEKYICEICGREFNNFINPAHIKTHKITINEYNLLYSFTKNRFSWNHGLGGAGICVAWNKGLTQETSESVRKNIENVSGTLKKKYASGEIAVWSKGLTKENNESLQRIADGRMGDRNVAKRPEVQDKIRKTLIKTFEDHPEILENRKPSGINQFSSGYTSIELLVRDFLDENNIEYQHNKKVGRFHVDFIVENVAIECDGDYWHSKSGAKEKDEKKTRYLQGQGYVVLRFLGSDLINNFNDCKDKILWEINQKQNNLV